MTATPRHGLVEVIFHPEVPVDAFADRKAMTKRWAKPAHIDLEAVLEDPFLQRILKQLEWAGRGSAGARALDAVRTDFVANISHELKTPVSALAVLAVIVFHLDPAWLPEARKRHYKWDRRSQVLVKHLK